ncbi:MAG: hypothetical protein ABJO91_00415 [Ekhidna sp.]
MNSIFSQTNAAKTLQEKSMNFQNEELPLSEVFKQELMKKGEYDESKIRWIDHETVEVTNISGLAIHSFALRAEEMGKDIEYNKQTILKIKN